MKVPDVTGGATPAGEAPKERWRALRGGNLGRSLILRNEGFEEERTMAKAHSPGLGHLAPGGHCS